jgi:hypothetical protein
VLPSDRWPGHVSRADRAADRWPGRPLAHRTVRCTPDSPVNFSRSRRRKPESGWFAPRWSGAPDTVRCTPDSPVPQLETACWLYTANILLFFFSLFLTLRQNILVHKTNVLRLRNIPLLVICTLFIHCINSHFKHLSWHSITKILRNDPKAHFPFNISEDGF